MLTLDEYDWNDLELDDKLSYDIKVDLVDEVAYPNLQSRINVMMKRPETQNFIINHVAKNNEMTFAYTSLPKKC